MKSYMIIDGQWGSTGKGLIAGYLARQYRPDAVVCNFGPNAGHTFVFAGGSRVMTRQLPTGIVADSVKAVFIGPGAVIDPDVLERELVEFAHFLRGKRVFIHERAAVVNEDNRAAERALLSHISSTAKGTGSAMTAKTMRLDTAIARWYRENGDGCEVWPSLVVTHDLYVSELLKAQLLQIESAQGLELGVSSGSHYPYCTGRDVTPAQVLSDCGVPFGEARGCDVIATLRTFPIRVGDQYDGSGVKIGTSGPVYADQKEVTFAEIGVPDEKTTVTGKTRRIFTFSDYGMERAIRNLTPTHVFLNFVNYVSKNPAFDDPAVIGYVERIVAAHRRAMGWYPALDFVRWIGTGPEESHIVEFGHAQ